ncbi:hypothetical protein AYP1020_p32 (plasmid) [Staphylococcus capitis subsp. capitis]|uniref:hypothetical protein n=1 Tax=Staphylococcus capitis TaxID=29388 RepID=UPI00064B0BF8|nr:hypothetical protein [Staphylococcus capitis]AKL93487.1 hypothetical protein AYP1020_p32 [Staphylococcus capitis subsp. capitis]
MIMYIESKRELEVLIDKYQSIKKDVLDLESKQSIRSFRNNLTNALNNFEEYFNSAKGKNEIASEYNLAPGYYEGTYETQETLLRDFYLGRKEAIKEDKFNELDPQTQEDYQSLLNLREKMTECEMVFTDVQYELELSDEEYKKYKTKFEM